jgi:hypothetical protein
MKPLLPLILLTLAAVPITAVTTGFTIKPEAQRCIDYQDRVLPYGECSRAAQSVRVSGSLNPMPSHRFYYGGFGGAEVGSKAWGGSEYALSGHVYRAATADDTVDAAVASAVVNSPQPYVVTPPR